MRWLVAFLEWWLPTDGTPDPGAAGGSPHGGPSGRGGGEGVPSNFPCAGCGRYFIAYVAADGRSGWCTTCVDPDAKADADRRLADAIARGGAR